MLQQSFTTNVSHHVVISDFAITKLGVTILSWGTIVLFSKITKAKSANEQVKSAAEHPMSMRDEGIMKS